MPEHKIWKKDRFTSFYYFCLVKYDIYNPAPEIETIINDVCKRVSATPVNFYAADHIVQNYGDIVTDINAIRLTDELNDAGVFNVSRGSGAILAKPNELTHYIALQGYRKHLNNLAAANEERNNILKKQLKKDSIVFKKAKWDYATRYWPHILALLAILTTAIIFLLTETGY
jgi:hypothetical protein